MIQECIKMSEENNPKDDLKEEFNRFGDHLKTAFNSAWDSDERQNAQQKIGDGIDEVGKALNDFASSFSSSETGQKIINEVDDFGERLRSGEVEAMEKAKEVLIIVLQKVNDELKKASDHFSKKEE